jgi:hypothetical protein
MKLDRHDLQWILRVAPVAVLNALKAHPGNLFVAGGFVRDCIQHEAPKDIDIFATTPEQAKAWALDMAGDPGKLVVTDNAITIKGHRICPQFIHRWTFDTPEQCIASFDFTIAAAAFWHDGNGWTSHCDDRFYPDLAARRLVYLSPDRNEDAGGSMLRVLKFYQRGFRIPLDSLGAVVSRLLRGVDMENAMFWSGAGSRNQQDLDQYRAKILSGLLREVDPNVDPNHIAHLPTLEDEPQAPEVQP